MTPRTLAAYALCGPVTGFLLFWAVHHAARRNWPLATLCCAAIVAFYVGAPMVLGYEMDWLKGGMR